MSEPNRERPSTPIADAAPAFVPLASPAGLVPVAFGAIVSEGQEARALTVVLKATFALETSPMSPVEPDALRAKDEVEAGGALFAPSDRVARRDGALVVAVGRAAAAFTRVSVVQHGGMVVDEARTGAPGDAIRIARYAPALLGSHAVRLEGFRGAVVQSDLPGASAAGVVFGAGASGADAGSPLRLVLDTMILDADRMRSTLVWRASVALAPGVDPARVTVAAGVATGHGAIAVPPTRSALAAWRASASAAPAKAAASREATMILPDDDVASAPAQAPTPFAATPRASSAVAWAKVVAARGPESQGDVRITNAAAPSGPVAGRADHTLAPSATPRGPTLPFRRAEPGAPAAIPASPEPKRPAPNRGETVAVIGDAQRPATLPFAPAASPWAKSAPAPASMGGGAPDIAPAASFFHDVARPAPAAPEEPPPESLVAAAVDEPEPAPAPVSELERCAAIAGALAAARGPERAEVLVDHELSPDEWRAMEKRQRKVMTDAARRGDESPRDRFDEVFVSAWEDARGEPFDPETFARLSRAQERGRLSVALEDAELDSAVWARLRRVMKRRMRADAALAQRVAAAFSSSS